MGHESCFIERIDTGYHGLWDRCASYFRYRIYFLEPDVNTYVHGAWLAFTAGATVGFGDSVPSMPASRIFAVCIVLLGYVLFP